MHNILSWAGAQSGFRIQAVSPIGIPTAEATKLYSMCLAAHKRQTFWENLSRNCLSADVAPQRARPLFGRLLEVSEKRRLGSFSTVMRPPSQLNFFACRQLTLRRLHQVSHRRPQCRRGSHRSSSNYPASMRFASPTRTAARMAPRSTSCRYLVSAYQSPTFRRCATPSVTDSRRRQR